ncbi:MAG: Uncharacterised protein [SAR116 cluster bacterium MED-G04]|nr:MAG: Uncharacterised protein [SAR116 cluster bacterium MED-G04]
MGNVGERAAMNKGWVVFQGLHQIGLHRLLEQNGHRTISLDIAAIDRAAITAIGNDDIAKPLFKIIEIGGEAQNGHDLGRNGDIKPGFTGKTVGDTAEVADDLAKRTIVHIQHTPERHTPDVNFLLIAPVDVIIQHRGEEVMG